MSTDTCEPVVRETQSAVTSGSARASDETLIASVARGDQTALRVLFSRHYSRIFRFALRFVKDHEDAKSVVNDTFLIAWQQASQFEGRSQVATWLLSIARYRALGVVKTRRSGCEPLEDHIAQLVDSAERVDDRMQREDSSRYLRRCLDALPREQAQLIELHYFRGVSLKDAVTLTGVPINTIKTRMFLARRKLARMMANEDNLSMAPALVPMSSASCN
jgi:RNA polymerase sigma-70 factor (ECF subfamily)